MADERGTGVCVSKEWDDHHQPEGTIVSPGDGIRRLTSDDVGCCIDD